MDRRHTRILAKILAEYWSSKLLGQHIPNCNSVCCYCHRLASRCRSITPRWPRLTARLQRSAGDRLLSFRIWSTHLLRGRPGRRCHWLLGGRPRDRLTWQLSALWAGTSSGSLATWPKRALRRRLMVSESETISRHRNALFGDSEMDGRPMVAPRPTVSTRSIIAG